MTEDINVCLRNPKTCKTKHFEARDKVQASAIPPDIIIAGVNPTGDHIISSETAR